MKIFVMGDLHGDWNHLNTFINKKNPDIILQCGDFGYWPKFSGTTSIGKPIYDSDGLPTRMRNVWRLEDIKNKNTKIYFCDGNHEDHESLKNLESNEILPNVFYMKRGSTLTLPDGRIVLFMGGARSIDYRMRTPGIDWYPEETITQSDIYNLPDIKIDIIISHTCPLEFYKEIQSEFKFAKFNDPCYSALSYLLEMYKPSLWYFAHFHCCQEGQYKNTRWEMLGMSKETNWFTELKEKR